MQKLSFGELGEIACYRTDEVEQAQAARARGEKVMMGRRCSECGDLLFGENLDPNLQVECEEGYHYSRPGIYI